MPGEIANTQIHRCPVSINGLPDEVVMHLPYAVSNRKESFSSRCMHIHSWQTKRSGVSVYVLVSDHYNDMVWRSWDCCG